MLTKMAHPHRGVLFQVRARAGTPGRATAHLSKRSSVATQLRARANSCRRSMSHSVSRLSTMVAPRPQNVSLPLPAQSQAEARD